MFRCVKLRPLHGHLIHQRVRLLHVHRGGEGGQEGAVVREPILLRAPHRASARSAVGVGSAGALTLGAPVARPLLVGGAREQTLEGVAEAPTHEVVEHLRSDLGTGQTTLTGLMAQLK